MDLINAPHALPFTRHTLDELALQHALRFEQHVEGLVRARIARHLGCAQDLLFDDDYHKQLPDVSVLTDKDGLWQEYRFKGEKFLTVEFTYKEDRLAAHYTTH